MNQGSQTVKGTDQKLTKRKEADLALDLTKEEIPMKQTKGNWYTYSYHDLDGIERHGVSSSNGTYIGEEMTEGDANLIASAPEMLKMLKKVLINMSKHYGDIPAKDAIEINDLIAKAGGE